MKLICSTAVYTLVAGKQKFKEFSRNTFFFQVTYTEQRLNEIYLERDSFRQWENSKDSVSDK